VPKDKRAFAGGDWHPGNHLYPDAREAGPPLTVAAGQVAGLPWPSRAPSTSRRCLPPHDVLGMIGSAQTIAWGAAYPGEGENGWPTSPAS
jgi:hypothetical protein